MEQTIINLVGAGGLGALGWLVARFIGRQDEQAKELAELKVHLAGEYVTNQKLNQVLSELKVDLRYIRDRLDEIPHRRHGEKHETD